MINDNTMVIDIDYSKYLPAEKKVEEKKSYINIVLLVNIVFIVLCSVVISIGFRYKNSVASVSALEAPKAPLLYAMVNDTEDNDKSYVFKGDAQDNYIIFNNMVWRIVRVNSSGTITMILNDYININPWELTNFSLQDYLNNVFKEELDVSKLTKNVFCNDTISNLDNITCDSHDYNYVTLLDVNSFIDTIDNNTTFVTKNGEVMWLSNHFNEKEVWHTIGNKISHSDVSNLYEVKPVVTLKNNVTYISGSGTSDDPYKVDDKEELTIGSSVKLGNDYYYVYSTNDNIKLVLNKNLDNKYLFNNYEELFTSLNNDFYNNLEYKELLLDYEWETFDIKNNTISNQTIVGKVGMQSIFDFNINSIVDNYYLTTIDYHIIVNNNPIIYASGKEAHRIRPCIAISKDLVSSMRYEQGVYVIDNI